MTAIKPAKFVSVQCPCGASFDREVKRGRPQVWCPACLEVPFYERDRKVAEVGAEKPQTYAEVRAALDAEIDVIYAEHKVRFAAELAAGKPVFEVSTVVNDETAAKVREVYAKYASASKAAAVAEDAEVEEAA